MSFDDNLPPWVSKELLSEIKQRDNLENKAHRTNNYIDKLASKRKRNFVTGLKKNLKRTFFHNALERAKGDSKKLWKIIRLLVGNKKQKNNIFSLNGKTSNNEMAEELNNFFANFGPELAAKIPESLLNKDYNFDGTRPIFIFSNITYDEVHKLLMAIPDSKSTGLDKIPVKFLKLVPEVSVTILVHIINCSLNTGLLYHESH